MPGPGHKQRPWGRCEHPTSPTLERMAVLGLPFQWAASVRCLHEGLLGPGLASAIPRFSCLSASRVLWDGSSGPTAGCDVMCLSCKLAHSCAACILQHCADCACRWTRDDNGVPTYQRQDDSTERIGRRTLLSKRGVDKLNAAAVLGIPPTCLARQTVTDRNITADRAIRGSTELQSTRTYVLC